MFYKERSNGSRKNVVFSSLVYILQQNSVDVLVTHFLTILLTYVQAVFSGATNVDINPTYSTIKEHVGRRYHFAEMIKTAYKICDGHHNKMYIFKFR